VASDRAAGQSFHVLPSLPYVGAPVFRRLSAISVATGMVWHSERAFGSGSDGMRSHTSHDLRRESRAVHHPTSHRLHAEGSLGAVVGSDGAVGFGAWYVCW
jgi:hypothetical protein